MAFLIESLAACALFILFIGLCCVIGPESIIKKKDNEYFFKSAGYFERFL